MDYVWTIVYVGVDDQCVCMIICVYHHLSCFNHVQLFVTLWTITCQASLSMEFSRLLFPSLGDLSNPGIKPASLVSPALAGGFFTTSVYGEGRLRICRYVLGGEWMCVIVCVHVCGL